MCKVRVELGQPAGQNFLLFQTHSPMLRPRQGTGTFFNGHPVIEGQVEEISNGQNFAINQLVSRSVLLRSEHLLPSAVARAWRGNQGWFLFQRIMHKVLKSEVLLLLLVLLHGPLVHYLLLDCVTLSHPRKGSVLGFPMEQLSSAEMVVPLKVSPLS